MLINIITSFLYFNIHVYVCVLSDEIHEESLISVLTVLHGSCISLHAFQGIPRLLPFFIFSESLICCFNSLEDGICADVTYFMNYIILYHIIY